MTGDQSIDIREQMLICMIEQGALNVSTINGDRSKSSRVSGTSRMGGL